MEEDIELMLNRGNFDQINSSSLFQDLIHFYASRLVHLNDVTKKSPIRGIIIIKRSIESIQSDPNELTSIHSELILISLISKCFKPVLSILNQEIQEISKENGRFDVKYFLSYFYYGSIVLAANKQFGRSFDFLETVLSVQSFPGAISNIMIEAYKKYILVSLILSSKMAPNPNLLSISGISASKAFTAGLLTTSSCSSSSSSASTGHSRISNNLNQLKPLIPSSYFDLMRSFFIESNNPQAIDSVIGNNLDLFQRDKNLGLVKQVKEAFFGKNIKKLTKTFLTLSFNDLKERLSFPQLTQAEYYILLMVSKLKLYLLNNNLFII